MYSPAPAAPAPGNCSCAGNKMSAILVTSACSCAVRNRNVIDQTSLSEQLRCEQVEYFVERVARWLAGLIDQITCEHRMMMFEHRVWIAIGLL